MSKFKKFNRQPEPPRKFDVHKNLPQSYIPESARRSLQTSAQQTEEPKPKKRRWIKRTALAVFLLVLLPLSVLTVWNGRNVSAAAEKMFGSGNLLNLLSPARLDNQKGRVNVLITGFSADDPGHGGAELTDSIMIMSLDKKTKTGYMLSVPRDLYVDIPGFGPAKINEAYQDGRRSGFSEKGYPKGGMGLLSKTISEKFDIQLHYYLLINYGSVREVVAELDGVTVDIDSDDPRGIYDPNFLPKEGGGLKLKNGRQKINASEALRLTRARGSTYGSYGFPQSDFDRGKNQRKVIKAIKEKLTWKILLDPRRNSEIFDAFASNIKTDVKFPEALPLFRLFRSVPDSKIKSAGLRDGEVNLLGSYRTQTGQSALIPTGGIDDYEEIKNYIDSLNK